MPPSITYRDIDIEVRRSSRRRTVDLVVDRGGNVVISVPEALPESEILRILRQKELWLYRTLGRKQEALYDRRPREYVSGEGFYYLGKTYRLKVHHAAESSASPPSLALRQGRFWLARAAVTCGRQAFVAWYTEHAEAWIKNRLPLLAERVGVRPRSVRVIELGFRWGSCGKGGALNFNWRTILLPPEKVRYVILHELVHLLETSHDATFYERLRCACPEYKAHETWLEENGDRYDL